MSDVASPLMTGVYGGENRPHKKLVAAVLVTLFTVLGAGTATPAHAYNFYAQNRVGLRHALAAKTDLAGENKRFVITTFGYPVYRKSSSTPQGRMEVWSYQPYKNGPARILVKFLNGKVIEVDYAPRVEDWKKIFGENE